VDGDPGVHVLPDLLEDVLATSRVELEHDGEDEWRPDQKQQP